MRMAMVGMLLAALVMMTASCAVSDPKMTLSDFMGFCVSDASDNCRGVCDDMAGVFVTTYPTALDCRKACDAQEERLGRIDVGRGCDSTVDRAADLCAQYCDKNK